MLDDEKSRREMKEIPSHFCPVPWLESYTHASGDTYPCCLLGKESKVTLGRFSEEEKNNYFNSEPFIKIRQSILKNERFSGCRKCWAAEDLGMLSRRQRAIRKYPSETQEILNVRNLNTKAPKRIDLRISNKCNLQCRMCNPGSSSQIAKFVNKLKEQGINNSFTQRQWNSENQTNFFKKYINSHDCVEELLFAGGEPFLESEFLNTLEELVKNGRAKKIRMQVLTNLTAIKVSTLEVLSKFKQVNLSCSMDGVSEEFEFQRWPSRWNICRDNFEKALLFSEKHSNLMVTVTPCVSHLNFRAMPSFIEFIHGGRSQKIHNTLNIVTRPEYLDFRIVPLKYRRSAALELQSTLESHKSMMFDKDFNTWMSFAEKLGSEYNEISPEQKIELRDAISCWQFQPGKTWHEIYPWAEELVNRNLLTTPHPRPLDTL